MKLRLSLVCFLSLIFVCAEIPAQGVYVTRDKNGPVFSDKPQAGSTELKLPPLTVIPAQPVPEKGTNKAQSPSDKPEAKTTEREPPELVSPYRSLAILAPKDGVSVAGDVSYLDVRLAVDPPLLWVNGHSFLVRINGRPVDQQFTVTEFVIPPGFWPEGYLPANQHLQLDVAVIDGGGQILTRAPTVNFRSLPVFFRSRDYPMRPGYRPGNRPPPPKEARPAKPPKKPGARVPNRETSKAKLKKD
jgi:hypothetical protein